DAAPLGRVAAGFGNNGEDGTEGCRYRNAFGTYLHGSLLPKNPALADLLISLAVERKYGSANLAPLDDSLELAAHQTAQQIARRESKTPPSAPTVTGVLRRLAGVARSLRL